MFRDAPRTLLVLLGLDILQTLLRFALMPAWTIGGLIGLAFTVWLYWHAANGKGEALRYLGPFFLLVSVALVAQYILLVMASPETRLVAMLTYQPLAPHGALSFFAGVFDLAVATYIWRSTEVRSYMARVEKFVI
jgi:hypothetical protein